MVYSSSITFLLLLIFLCIQTGIEVEGGHNTAYSFNMGPTNITRSVGARSVFIPCPAKEAAIWKISGLYYDQYSMPEEYIPQQPHGLLITEINAEMNGATFQCIYGEATSKGPQQKRSSVAVLTVVDRSLST